jgi:hypothetical protein
MASREQEVYGIIRPLLEGYTEGLNWDFKKVLSDTAEIIKDVLAFSNSSYSEDSYIIAGVTDSASRRVRKLKLSTNDRQRLNTDANYLYLPSKFDVHGLDAAEVGKMARFSAELTQKITSSMLISQPELEFVPIQIKPKIWLYVIVVKPVSGVFISNKDLENKDKKVVVKQGVLYVRHSDTTAGAGGGNVATAGDHIRIWKNYLSRLDMRQKTSVDEDTAQF